MDEGEWPEGKSCVDLSPREGLDRANPPVTRNGGETDLSPHRLSSYCPTKCHTTPAVYCLRASSCAVITLFRPCARRLSSCSAAHRNGFTRLRSWVRVPQRPLFSPGREGLRSETAQKRRARRRGERGGRRHRETEVPWGAGRGALGRGARYLPCPLTNQAQLGYPNPRIEEQSSPPQDSGGKRTS